MNFKIGQKVVCIENFDKRRTYKDLEKHPNKGDVLTIREICEYGLRFEEIHNPILHYRDVIGETAYIPKFFVPLEEKFERITFKEVIKIEQELTCAN